MSVEHAHLLIEIGTEELPPGALLALSKAFADGIRNALIEKDLVPPESAARRFETPRRMAVLIADVAKKQADRSQQRLGPAVAAAFDADGNPTRAAEGFARSVGADSVNDLARIETDKGERLGFEVHTPGQTLESLLPEIITSVAQRLPIPKLMRWGAGDDRFVRPVHWIAVVHGDEPVSGELFGCTFQRQSRGHRFLHPGNVWLSDAADYADAMQQAHVVADTRQRREQIAADVQSVADQYGLKADMDAALLDEVANLVEWPVAVYGEYDSAFLEVPDEALVSSMQKHQRFFPLRNKDAHLAPAFVGVANVRSKNPDAIREGYQRVIRPRLADAQFFFEQDRKTPLADRGAALENVVYQKQLGSLADKSRRVEALATTLADAFGAPEADAANAARLAKCDLLTDMVGEFPELQGIMGDYYARGDGVAPGIAVALREQYQPGFAGDAIPTSSVGRCLAVAERIDTLTGIFGVGLKPSGTRDPFALRRAALGLIRIAIESETCFDLRATLSAAARQLPLESLDHDALVDEVAGFVIERLRGYLAEQDISADVFNAVAAVAPDELNDFVARCHAVRAFLKLDAAESLCAANKRIANILRKSADDHTTFDSELVSETAERSLADALHEVRTSVAPLVARREYASVLEQLASLRDVVDTFFDEVLVMDEDPRIRRNRLALLAALQGQFRQVADIGIAA